MTTPQPHFMVKFSDRKSAIALKLAWLQEKAKMLS